MMGKPSLGNTVLPDFIIPVLILIVIGIRVAAGEDWLDVWNCLNEPYDWGREFVNAVQHMFVVVMLAAIIVVFCAPPSFLQAKKDLRDCEASTEIAQVSKQSKTSKKPKGNAKRGFRAHKTAK